MLKATKPHKETPFQTLAISFHSIRILKILTISQKNIVDFLDNIVAKVNVETNAEERIILIENEDEASLDLNRLWFSFDPISGSKWLITIHNTEAV